MKDVFDLLCSKLQVYAGFVQSPEFSRKCWNLPSNFPDLKKVWKMEIKYGKIVKSLEFFFLYSKLQQVLIRSEILSVLVKSYSILPVRSRHTMQKALFLHFLCLYWSPKASDNLESGKRNYCFVEKSGKSLEFWIQKSGRILYIFYRSNFISGLFWLNQGWFSISSVS